MILNSEHSDSPNMGANIPLLQDLNRLLIVCSSLISGSLSGMHRYLYRVHCLTPPLPCVASLPLTLLVLVWSCKFFTSLLQQDLIKEAYTSLE